MTMLKRMTGTVLLILALLLAVARARPTAQAPPGRRRASRGEARPRSAGSRGRRARARGPSSSSEVPAARLQAAEGGRVPDDAVERPGRLHRGRPRDPVVRCRAADAGRRRRRRLRRPRSRGMDDQRGVDSPQRPGGGGGGGAQSFLEPKDKLGLQAICGSVMRVGRHDVDDRRPDQRADGVPGRQRVADRAVDPHAPRGRGAEDLAGHPATTRRFPEDRLRREKDSDGAAGSATGTAISRASRRATWAKLMYGEDSPIAAEVTEATINSITRDDLVAWHKKYLGRQQRHPGGGRRLQEGRDAAEARGDVRQVAPAETRRCRTYPKVDGRRRRPGVYMVQPHGATPNQGVIRIGTLGLTQDDPDYAAVDLMNYTLGGGSFSSRITQVVRNDNGLAYSASSAARRGPALPGDVRRHSARPRTRPWSSPRSSCMNEIERMRGGDVTEKDLRVREDGARSNAFPSMFSTVFGNIGRLRAGSSSTAGRRTTTTRYLRPLREGDGGRHQAGRAEVPAARQDGRSWSPATSTSARPARTSRCRTRATIDAMAAKYGGRTIDGLAKKFGDGTVHVVTLK